MIYLKQVVKHIWLILDIEYLLQLWRQSDDMDEQDDKEEQDHDNGCWTMVVRTAMQELSVQRRWHE